MMTLCRPVNIVLYLHAPWHPLFSGLFPPILFVDIIYPSPSFFTAPDLPSLSVLPCFLLYIISYIGIPSFPSNAPARFRQALYLIDGRASHSLPPPTTLFPPSFGSLNWTLLIFALTAPFLLFLTQLTHSTRLDFDHFIATSLINSLPLIQSVNCTRLSTHHDDQHWDRPALRQHPDIVHSYHRQPSPRQPKTIWTGNYSKSCKFDWASLLT